MVVCTAGFESGNIPECLSVAPAHHKGKCISLLPRDSPRAPPPQGTTISPFVVLLSPPLLLLSETDNSLKDPGGVPPPPPFQIVYS